MRGIESLQPLCRRSRCRNRCVESVHGSAHCTGVDRQPVRGKKSL
jgi:hypothetical protein